jgi:hypothetical protein
MAMRSRGCSGKRMLGCAVSADAVIMPGKRAAPARADTASIKKCLRVLLCKVAAV